MNKTSYLYLLLFVLYFNCISAQESEELNNNARESTSNFYTSQLKKQNSYDGLGYYKLYNNSLNYTIDRLSITLGAGFLEQNTIYNSNAPGFYGSFSTNVEYKISNRFSHYLFGRYLTPSLNGEQRINNPHMNFLFPQTEIGAGLRGNFNNVNIDLGASTIYDTQLNQSMPNTILRSKVSIGF